MSAVYIWSWHGFGFGVWRNYGIWTFAIGPFTAYLVPAKLKSELIPSTSPDEKG